MFMICGYFEKILNIPGYSYPVRVLLLLWFHRSLVGSYVKLSPVVVAILDFRLEKHHKL